MLLGPQWELLELESGDRAPARARHRDAAHVSRSYSGGYALLAWHGARVGVDIERVRAVPAGFCESICTPAERRPMVGASAELVTALWSSKEALAKALGDAGDYDPRRLGSPMFWTGGAAGRWRTRRIAVPPGYLAWLCWAEPEASAATAV